MDESSRSFKKILKKLKNPKSIIVNDRLSNVISEMSEFIPENEYDLIGTIFETKIYVDNNIRGNVIVIKSDLTEYDLELDLGVEIEDLI